MTPEEFGAVDIDLLADYIGGALDDPEQQRVARLVADDPEWRSAFALLSPGMAQVGLELGALGAAAEPMPDDLSVRLDAAFSESDHASAVTLIDEKLAEPTEPHLLPSRGERHLVSVPTGSSVRPAPRRRRLRWAAPIAAAAGVLAFAGFGTAYLTGRSDDSAESTAAGSSQADEAAAAPMMADSSGGGVGLVTVPGDGQIGASDTDYSATSLSLEPAAGVVGAQGTANGSERTSAAPKQQLYDSRDAPTGLARLWARDALTACLQAVARENGTGPIAVQSVDYARYEGTPALIVRFTAAGIGWAWATGPDCGAPNLGSQVRKVVQVG